MNRKLHLHVLDFAGQECKTANGKPWARPPKRKGRPWRDDRVRRAFNWYTCLKGLGLDVESTPIHVATIFSTAWAAAGKPRNVASWRERDAKGLEAFAERVQRPTP